MATFATRLKAVLGGGPENHRLDGAGGAFSYRLLLRLLFPAIAAGTAAVALRDGSTRYLAQRLGRFDAVETPSLWIHCASVGETNAALKLITAWLKHRPEDAFVVTTNTVTAARMLAKRTAEGKPARVRHCYLPLDYPLFCRRFLSAVKPRCALIMETEIWLNLFCECRRRNVPLFIVNARASRRTLDGARRFKGYYRQSLATVDRVFARSEKDAEAFAALGAAPDKIEVAGNLKWAKSWSTAEREALPDLIGRRYVLAASTREDEETKVAEAWRRACNRSNRADDGLLVIAPRHPRRGRAIAKQLNDHGFRTQLRSRAQSLENNAPGKALVYIADTIGELPALIRHADLVFTGGSLVPVGGHNVLEAAQLGVPQAVGPHTDNFQDEVAALKAVGGLIEVTDENALEEVFRAALDQTPAPADFARNALALMQQREDVADVYAARVEAAVRTQTEAT